MKIRPLMLTPTFAKNVKAPGRYGDGRGGLGLSLRVRPASHGGFTKSWTQYVRIGGRPTSLGLGRYPVVTLAKARERALENARAIADGRDPRGGSPRGVPTFAQALETVIAIHAQNWKDRSSSEHQWRATLTTYAFPRIGSKRVDEVTTADVMAILTPIWSSKHVTAKRIRQRIGAVMKWAVAQGHRPDNPAGEALGAALPKSGAVQKHQRALPHAEVGAALRHIRHADAHIGTRLAFEFLVLTAARSGEVRGALWDEIDCEGAVWTIPGERMKAGREHRVPLADRALEVLDEAGALADEGGIVFPSPRGLVLHQTSLAGLARDLEIDAVPHGFRSSFRDWAAECTDAPREVCEIALAHVNTDRVEAAYRRTDLFDRRRRLMADWAAYVA